jgi:hypothetical protein
MSTTWNVFYGIAAFEKLFRHMSEVLTEQREWLVGITLSLGDINLMPFVARLDYLNLLDLFIAERETVRSWWQRCKGLRSYQKAIPDMLNEEDTSEMHASGTKIRERIGELRAEHLAQHRKAMHPAGYGRMGPDCTAGAGGSGMRTARRCLPVWQVELVRLAADPPVPLLCAKRQPEFERVRFRDAAEIN